MTLVQILVLVSEAILVVVHRNWLQCEATLQRSVNVPWNKAEVAVPES